MVAALIEPLSCRVRANRRDRLSILNHLVNLKAFFMGNPQKFYMIRLKGGQFDPRRKYSSLKKVMEVACIVSAHHQKSATILQSFSRVSVKDGKPTWENVTPEK